MVHAPTIQSYNHTYPKCWHIRTISHQKAPLFPQELATQFYFFIKRTRVRVRVTGKFWWLLTFRLSLQLYVFLIGCQKYLENMIGWSSNRNVRYLYSRYTYETTRACFKVTKMEFNIRTINLYQKIRILSPDHPVVTEIDSLIGIWLIPSGAYIGVLLLSNFDYTDRNIGPTEMNEWNMINPHWGLHWSIVVWNL